MISVKEKRRTILLERDPFILTTLQTSSAFTTMTQRLASMFTATHSATATLLTNMVNVDAAHLITFVFTTGTFLYIT